jgi:hypothetical protein
MPNEELNTFTLKSFTTEPKFRRFLKRGAFISLNRALEFMKHLWDLKLKNVSYETLEFEFIQFFGSNDKRTVERYLGRPERIQRDMGLSKVVRMNRQSGKIAQFEYMNERRIPEKKGLLEILGYITRIKEGKETRFRINHEAMPYYTVQTSLQEHEPQETANLQQEREREGEDSKEDLRVCNLCINPSLNCEAKGEWGKLPIVENNIEVSPETERGDMGGDKKEEEEVIDSTHTNQTSVKVNANFPSIHGKLELKCSLTEEEMAILTVKPTPKKCVDCGRINASNPYSVLCPKGLGMRSRSDVCVLEGGP